MLAACAALLVSAAAGAFSAAVWPRPGDPNLEPGNSPGVARNGRVLTFVGQVPWVGRQRQENRRISFGDAPPKEEPEPDKWIHFAPDAVTFHSSAGTQSLTPLEVEWKTRFGLSALTLLLDLIFAMVFFFVIGMLLRVKRVQLPPFGAMSVAARCLIPACLLSAPFFFLGTKLSATLSICSFLLVFGMNVLLYIQKAEPVPEPEPSFDV